MKAGLAIFALLYAAPVAAQEAPPAASDYTALSDDDLRGRVREAQQQRTGDQCDYAAMTAELARRAPQDAQARNVSRLDQASCHASRGEFADAVVLLEEIDASVSGNRLERFGVYVSSAARDGEKTLKWVRRTVRYGSLPEMMREQPDGMMSSFRLILQSGLQREHNALCADIAQANWFGDVEFLLQNWCAGAALSHRVAEGNLSQVPRLLGYLRTPESYLSMLANRQFEAVWPQLEARAGDHLETVITDFVVWTAQHLAEDPDDRDRLSLYAHALLYAGRDEEAAVLASNWLADAERDGGIEEGDGWALEIQARALGLLGRRAEADAVFDRLVQSRPDAHWMVNFVINRAIRLRSQGRWQESLDAFDLARPVADRTGTDYARLLVAAGRACTLHRLGRGAEAETEFEYLIEHAETYVPVAATALLCADRRADAEKLIVTAFERPDGELTFIDAMQESRFDLTAFDYSEEASSASVRSVILEREDLKARLLERVRLLPDHLTPIGYLRREERRLR